MEGGSEGVQEAGEEVCEGESGGGVSREVGLDSWARGMRAGLSFLLALRAHFMPVILVCSCLHFGR